MFQTRFGRGFQIVFIERTHGGRDEIGIALCACQNLSQSLAACGRFPFTQRIRNLHFEERIFGFRQFNPAPADLWELIHMFFADPHRMASHAGIWIAEHF